MRSVPLAFALALLVPTEALAGFVKGPFLQRVTPTEVTVSWEMDTSGDGTVSWGTSQPFSASLASTDGTTFHQVRLTGLLPSTEYVYQVVQGADASFIGSFVTAPHTDEPFSFVVVGDTRTGEEDHQAVMDAILATVGAPDLYFNTGDLVEEGDDESLWDIFFDIESQVLLHAPFYPVAGNHDDVANDSLFVRYFDLPSDTSGWEGWYDFVHGNTLFLVIDTEDDFSLASDQYAWLEATLDRADADPTIRNRLAFFHTPPYTSHAHGVFDDAEWQAVRDSLCPVLADRGVEVVFNGHDHHYERTDPLVTDGVLYVVAGGGGAPGDAGDYVEGIDSILSYLGLDEGETVGEFLETNTWVWDLLKLFGFAQGYEGGWWRAEAEVTKFFVYVEVAGDRIDGSVYETDGSLLDAWSVGTWDGSVVDDDGDGWTEAGGDCDDDAPGRNPGVDDPCDGVDQDCDGKDDGCDTGDPPTPDTGDPPAKDTGVAGEDAPPEDKGCGCGGGRAVPTGLGATIASLLLALSIRRRGAARP